MTHVITRWAAACAVLCVALGGWPIETMSQETRAIRIEVADFPRPLAAAVFQVERHFGRIVTYEDGSCITPDDILDETAIVRRDGKTTPRILGRRPDSIGIAYMPTEASVDAQVEAVLRKLLAQWNGPRHSGEFRLKQVVGGYHVIPVSRKAVGGNAEPYTSPLETLITFAKEERDLEETMSVVAQAISASSGREVTSSMSRGLGRARVAVGAENQNAREVLWNTLQAIDSALSWQLLCDVGEDSQCTINIYRVAGA